MQAKINTFFKPKSSYPSLFEDLPDSKSPQIRITYERRSPSQRTSKDEIDEGSTEESTKNPNSLGSPSKEAAGRILNRKRSYAQLHLELGQSDFLLRTCLTCGLKYAPGDEIDEHVHSTFHKNYTHGVQFKGWRNERVVYAVPGDAGRVVLVLDGDPPSHRNKVKEVVEMMEIDFGSGWVLHDECKVYLYICSKRIAGCLVAEPRASAYKSIPNSDDGSTDDNTTGKSEKSVSTTLQFGNVSFCREVVKRAPSVNRKRNSDIKLNGATHCEPEAIPVVCGVRAIWVSPSNRRKHIATHLLDAVRKSFQMDIVLDNSRLAFSQPTSSGKALFSRYTGSSSFLVY